MEQRFWGWPGWQHIGESYAWGLLWALGFCIVYGGADYLTGLRPQRVGVHTSFELRIPLVPAALLGYLSIYPLFWIAPFVLRSRREVRAFVGMLSAVTLLAGLGFLLVPAELAYPPPTDLGVWGPLFRFAEWMNLTYNLVPSLHVAYAVACAEVYSGKARAAGQAALRGWAAVIAISTLLTHQHHLLDVVCGLVLGLAAGRFTRFGWTDASDP